MVFYLVSRPREIKYVEFFCERFVLLARNFKFTKTPRESYLDAYDDCYLDYPTLSRTLS